MVEQNISSAGAGFKDAVCIDAGRVYDSCCDRDCLEDLRVFFTPYHQEIIDQALNVRCRSAEVVNVLVDVEAVSFNRGFYSCDLTFFFLITLDVYTAPHSQPCEVKGISVFEKKVILYGSEGNVRTFTSCGAEDDREDKSLGCNVPKCVVQVVDPVVLAARVCENRDCCDPCRSMPACVTNRVGGELCGCEGARRAVYVTLGLFTIVQLIRNVAILVPVYDFCTPKKECETTTDAPCDAFRRIKFPTEEFFPPKEWESGCSKGDCPC